MYIKWKYVSVIIILKWKKYYGKRIDMQPKNTSVVYIVN